MTKTKEVISISDFAGKLTENEILQVAVYMELNHRVVSDYINGKRHVKSTKVAILSYLKDKFSHKLSK